MVSRAYCYLGVGEVSAGYNFLKQSNVIGVSLIPSDALVPSLLGWGQQNSPGDGGDHGNRAKKPGS